MEFMMFNEVMKESDEAADDADGTERGRAFRAQALGLVDRWMDLHVSDSPDHSDGKEQEPALVG